MAQPRPMSGTVYHAASNALCLMGKFINSPTCREWASDWKTGSPGYRKHQKRALRKYRRQDGKRWVLEGLAAVQEEQAELQADAKSAYLDAIWDGYDPDVDDDYEREYCGCPSQEEHDYWADRDDYYNGSDEDRYQEEQSRLDWGWDVHQEYLNGLQEGISRGYQEGYRQALRDSAWDATFHAS